MPRISAENAHRLFERLVRDGYSRELAAFFADHVDRTQARVNLAARALIPTDPQAVQEFYQLQGEVICAQRIVNTFAAADQQAALEALLADRDDEFKPPEDDATA